MTRRATAFQRLQALSSHMTTALVALDATPRRDPKTGAFTARGSFTPNALRRAWSTATPRPPAYKAALLSAMRTPKR